MKRKSMLVLGGLILACLTACQGMKPSVSETSWKAAKKAASLEEYMNGNRDTLDVEALKAEAESTESPLSQKFKATALLCTLEYWQNMENSDYSEFSTPASKVKSKDGVFLAEYPVSSSLAEQYLASVNTQGDAFWESLDDVFYPYDCFLPMFAAAKNLDGQTLVNLTSGIPSDSRYGDKLKSAIDKWVQLRPETIVTAGEALINSGYFKDWKLEDWKKTYLYNYSSDLVRTDSAEEAVGYINYVRASLLPMLESDFGKEELVKQSELTGEEFYSTNLTVTADQELKLQEPQETGLPETIDIQEKKVAAFYRNTLSQEFKNSPSPLMVLGDFMLNLPEDAFPKTLGEADYYLVLTPDYEYGEYYRDQSGNDSKIRQVFSSTSIDLYDAKSGALLRHLGNVMEEPPSNVYKDMADEADEYPEITSSDVLSYIYHHVNEPETYAALTDSLGGLNGTFAREQPVSMGSWEITYHSNTVEKSFIEGMYEYTAKEGHRFVRANLTIANRGTENDSFLPMISNLAEDPIVRIADSKQEAFYPSVEALSNDKCLNGDALDPGQSKDGELLFEVPEELLDGTEPLYIAISYRNQSVYCPLD